MADVYETHFGDLWTDEEAKAMDEFYESANSDFLTAADKKMLTAKYGILFEEDFGYNHSEWNEDSCSVDDWCDGTGKQATYNHQISVSASSYFTDFVPVVSPKLEANLNKPLPPIPDLVCENEYSGVGEYDVEIQSKNSIDNLSFGSNDDENSVPNLASSPPVLDPLTPPGDHDVAHDVDMSAIAQLSFMHAGIHLTTKDIVDDHLAALGTGLAGNLEIDEADQLEKEQASIGFYGGFKVEESPGPFHVPVFDEQNGYGDVREGAEDFPEQWSCNEKQPKAFPLAVTEALEYETAFGPTLPMKGAGFANESKDATPDTSDQLILPQQPFVAWGERPISETYHKLPCLVNSIEKKKLNNGRSDDSAYDVQQIETQDATDNQLGSKPLSPLQVGPKDSKSSKISFNLDCTVTDGQHDNIATYNGTDVLPGPVLGAQSSWKAYRGQFGVIEVASGNANVLYELQGKSQPTSIVAFGDRLHPNYLYVHTACVVDPDYPTVQHSFTNLKEYSPTHFAIIRASDLTIASASNNVSHFRTISQENLRKQAHIDCSSARLEGVSVGRYRYYQGHLSVEEYNQAGMCVCWDMCSCTKMCSRFGDLLCPCADNIAIQKI